MQRLALGLVILVVLGACHLGTFLSPPAPSAFVPGETVTITGTVIENNQGCTVDVACLLVVNTGEQQVEVVYHYGEYPPCDNHAAVDAGFQIAAGDRVEVFAQATGAAALSTCDDVIYTIRKLD